MKLTFQLISGVDSNQKTCNSFEVATTTADSNSKPKVCNYYSYLMYNQQVKIVVFKIL